MQDENETIKDLEQKVKLFQEQHSRGEKYNAWQAKLEIPLTVFTCIEELNEIVNIRHLLWSSNIDWKKLANQYKISLFKEIKEKEI